MRFEGSLNGGATVHHNSESSLVVEVTSKKHLDLGLMELIELFLGKWNVSFSLRGDCVLRYPGRLCVPDEDGLKDRILEEIFWWECLNRNIEEFVAMCPNCQQAKSKQQKPGGSLQEIQIPTRKWESINMDFVVGLPWTKSHMILYKWLWIDLLSPLILFSSSLHIQRRITQ